MGISQVRRWFWPVCLFTGRSSERETRVRSASWVVMWGAQWRDEVVPTSEEEFLCLTFTYKEHWYWVVGQLNCWTVWDFTVQRTFYCSFKNCFYLFLGDFRVPRTFYCIRFLEFCLLLFLLSTSMNKLFLVRLVVSVPWESDPLLFKELPVTQFGSPVLVSTEINSSIDHTHR